MRSDPQRRGARVRAGHPRDPQRADRWAALLFFALPSFLATLGMGVWLGASGAAGDFDDPAYKLYVVMMPLLAAFGAVGAWQLERRWVLGSAAALAVGALLAFQQPALMVWYALTAALMYLTTRKL